MIKNLLAGGLSAALFLTFSSPPKETEFNRQLEITEVKTAEQLIENTKLYKEVAIIEYRADSLHKELKRLKDE